MFVEKKEERLYGLCTMLNLFAKKINERTMYISHIYHILSLFQLDGSMAGDVGFDPLGLSNINDVGIDLYWLREAELKHCRLCMLAFAGFVEVELFGPAPGNEMATAKNQMEAFWQFWNAHPQYIAFSFILIGITEMISGIATTTGRESGMRAPGDFGFDPLGFMKGKSAAEVETLKLKEVTNGRTAMWATAGLIMQGMTTGQGGLENLFGGN